MLELGDEFEGAAAAIAIAEATPYVLVEIAHELLAVCALMDGARSEQLRSDALELRQDAVMLKHGCEGHDAFDMLKVVDPSRVLRVQSLLLSMAVLSAHYIRSV